MSEHPRIFHMGQKFARDCGVAAICMVTEFSWDQVANWFQPIDFDKQGLYSAGVESFLADHGYAVRKVAQYRGRMCGDVPRAPWPVQPFADYHLVHVDVHESAPISHWVAMDACGNVHDPLCADIRSLSDYARVYAIYGIYKAPDLPH